MCFKHTTNTYLQIQTLVKYFKLFFIRHKKSGISTALIIK
jgi:hypothetical protein